MLDILYAGAHPSISILASDTLTSSLRRMILDYAPHMDALHPAHGLGVYVARRIFDILGVKPGQPGADQGRYEPKSGRYYFRDEPVTPVRPSPIDPNEPGRGASAARVYHAPFYGLTVPDFAVTDSDGHRIDDWPKPGKPGGSGPYQDALEEVVRLGGAPSLSTTHRTPDQTVVAYYWAYDGANLIGTPPRLYNQIARIIIWSKRLPQNTDLKNTSEFVRALALVNVAMADAGKYAWREKYRYELWRPLSGVREHDKSSDDISAGETKLTATGADPFWLALGAPETNTDRVSFKPPFPAYPSGHATFGAAAFQMLRLFYWARGGKLPTNLQTPKDGLSFAFVSEELNGVSRDLRQPYDPSRPIEDQQGTVRTRVKRKFDNLWDAIFENAFSRIYLGVHWNFDAADPQDIKGKHGKPQGIKYKHVWTQKRNGGPYPIGGVPLGLGIANDIFGNEMKQPIPVAGAGAADAQETRSPANQVPLSVERAAKFSNTTYR